MELENGYLNDISLFLAFDGEKLQTGSPIWIVTAQEDVNRFPEFVCGIKLAAENLSGLTFCEGFFEKFPAVIIALTGDFCKQVENAFCEFLPDVKVFVPSAEVWGNHKTLCELCNAGGEKALERLVTTAHQVLVPGLLDVSDIKTAEYEEPTFLTRFPSLDEETGGLFAGELSIITGKRGHGKSSLISQLALSAIDQGRKVAVYSGEMPASVFRQWALAQAAGNGNIEKTVDPTSKHITYSAKPEVASKIDAWWKGRFFLLDNAHTGHGVDNILAAFLGAKLRYGVSIFICDNLLTMGFASGSDADFYRQQSMLVGQLASFAKDNGVSVILCCHPRKGQGQISADDVSGSSGIVDRCDNLFSVQRDSATDADGNIELLDTGTISILKNRRFGASGFIPVSFDRECRRYWETAKPTRISYGWERLQEIEPDGSEPF